MLAASAGRHLERREHAAFLVVTAALTKLLDAMNQAGVAHPKKRPAPAAAPCLGPIPPRDTDGTAVLSLNDSTREGLIRRSKSHAPALGPDSEARSVTRIAPIAAHTVQCEHARSSRMNLVR